MTAQLASSIQASRPSTSSVSPRSGNQSVSPRAENPSQSSGGQRVFPRSRWTNFHSTAPGSNGYHVSNEVGTGSSSLSQKHTTVGLMPMDVSLSEGGMPRLASQNLAQPATSVTSLFSPPGSPAKHTSSLPGQGSMFKVRRYLRSELKRRV